MYYIISQVYPESQNSEKSNIFARFFDKFCFLSVMFQYLFYCENVYKKLTLTLCSKMKKGGVKEI